MSLLALIFCRTYTLNWKRLSATGVKESQSSALHQLENSQQTHLAQDQEKDFPGVSLTLARRDVRANQRACVCSYTNTFTSLKKANIDVITFKFKAFRGIKSIT